MLESPGVGSSAYSRSQRRCGHVGNLAMPGELLPLSGSPPQPWPRHHVQLPRRPGWVEEGWSNYWPALLPPPWRSLAPSTTSVGLQPSQVSAPQGKAWHDSFLGQDCLPLTSVAPFSGCWAGRPVLALTLPCSVLSKN